MESLTLEQFTSNFGEILGFAASGATLAAFAQKNMLPMRMSAIVANICFIGYGALGSFYPVLILHIILLPLNILRLLQQRDAVHTNSGTGIMTSNLSLMDEWRSGHSHSPVKAFSHRPQQAPQVTYASTNDNLALSLLESEAQGWPKLQ